MPGLSLGLGLGLSRRSGGGGPRLPEGALGAWYADEYDATTRAIPNAVSPGSPLSSNMFRGSRRLFANNQIWAKSGVTCTDDYGTAPDGSSEASRAVGTGNCFLSQTLTLLAGTYTLAFYVKSNTGSDQAFRSSFNTKGDTVSRTATSTWQRFTHTTTVTAGSQQIIPIWSPDGSTGWDLQICDIEIYAGSSDLGPMAYVGHLYLGKSQVDTAASVSGGELNLAAAGAWGSIQLPANVTIGSTGVTALALVSKTANGGSYHSYLSKAQNFNHFTAMIDQGGGAVGIPFDLTGNVWVPAQRSGLWALKGRGYQAISHRYDGTNRDMFLDDARIMRRAATISDFTLRDLWVGNTSGTIAAGEKIVAIELYSRALTDDEVRARYAAMQARALRSAITATPVPRVLVADGHSIAALDGGYVYLSAAAADPAVLGANYAVTGSTLANLNSRAAILSTIPPPDRTGRKFILSVQIGTNDLATYTGGAAQFIADLAAYCDTMRAAGYAVLVCTLLPISGDATFNSRRATVNAAITGGWLGVHCDGIADFGGDATMGPDSSYTDNPTLWTDVTHPSLAGHAVLSTIHTAALDAT